MRGTPPQPISSRDLFEQHFPQQGPFKFAVDTVYQMAFRIGGKRPGQATPAARPVTEAVAAGGAPFEDLVSEPRARAFVNLDALGGYPPNRCQLGQPMTVVNHLDKSFCRSSLISFHTEGGANRRVGQVANWEGCLPQ